MAHQENQVTGKISEDLDDEKRLYECVRKYEIIVKQFDELMAIMSNGNAVAKTKWRKVGSPNAAIKEGMQGRRGNASGGRAAASSIQTNNNEIVVQTVTRFLHELRNNPTDSE
ncbi:hypothetical protein JHK82_036225 [Glycine max]|nr:hypothetical protein JHK85_036957 [Glycine max]KAG4976940.1 hypothetical protein JHK86_036414 [Glycine max]KAG5112956.1 hypothetical protein JHK82_036225 [Glycine max]KAG5130235.1 hypothetical protein JHK84_036632 [Glycine max]KAH1216786.1 hypothetical protein GmHk_13G037576 [Glycine max]